MYKVLTRTTSGRGADMKMKHGFVTGAWLNSISPPHSLNTNDYSQLITLHVIAVLSSMSAIFMTVSRE